MKWLSFSVTSLIAIANLGLLTACGGQTKLESCKFVEIEEPEFEVEFGDVDIEGGEIEMVCGDRIIDVAWNQFEKKLRVNPKQYINRLEGFKRQVSCFKDEKSREKFIFCNRSGGDLVKLNFTYDD